MFWIQIVLIFLKYVYDIKREFKWMKRIPSKDMILMA
jgi:hypothetical protein